MSKILRVISAQLKNIDLSLNVKEFRKKLITGNLLIIFR